MTDFFNVPAKKSSYHAKKYLNIGNSKLKKQKYFEALENFNKSLCLAETGSNDELLAYASRSKVYAEANEAEKSFNNNQLASSYLKSIKNKEKSNEILSEARDEPWSFFQLSYPSNDKIPYVANCLELKNDENFGRYIITKHYLKPGDIIAIEEPYFKIVETSACHLRCANCLRSNKMNLVPSSLTSSSEDFCRNFSQVYQSCFVLGMFCSQDCMQEATKTFHQAEVILRCIDFTQRILLETLSICDGSFDKLLSLTEDPAMTTKTIFDFDWNDEKNVKNKLHGLLAFNSLQLGPISDELSYVETHPVLNLFNDEREKGIAKAFMTRVARILTVNCYSLDWWVPKRQEDSFLSSSNKMKIGSAMLIFGSLFNHSCAPNIDRMFVDNKFVFIVRRPINEGEQLFISYG